MGPEHEPSLEYGTPEEIASDLAALARKDGMSAEAIALALASAKKDFEPGPSVVDDDIHDVFLQALEGGIAEEQIRQVLGWEN